MDVWFGKIALYSAKAAAEFGTVTYELQDGRIVECTAVYDKDHIDEYMWDDKVELGVCKRLISSTNMKDNIMKNTYYPPPWKSIY